MGYWVYKTITTVNDSSLIAEDAKTTLSGLLPLIFRPSNIQPHKEIVDIYTYTGKQIGFKRYLNQNKLVTERVFTDQATAQEFKSETDNIYDDNIMYQTETGNLDKFTFEFLLYEITESEFMTVYV